MNLNAFKIGDKYPVFTKKIDAKKDFVSGEWMIPAYATDVELIPEKAGFQRYFVKADQAWYYVVDNIGTEYWDEDGTKHIIKELGEEVPEGALFEAPVITPTVTELAAAARAKRNAWLSAISWRYERHASELRLGINVTDSIESLDTYAQTLRDITEQEGFPTTIDWPTEL
ncbi:hypothetical protein MSP8886_01808 [Marinomonas spartinae]|uniref:Phage tail assembly chaperone-like domain-containing protein n=1 Tax=Marinomonas spartinae TaxID=1792290 RepID=A0A1A8TEZ4_9GAMM|nr:phage tail assembly chaperone [Marinomonas spartinae]SBS30423.1 hypothetical protein MSP8886_01808 [Marinomonas spartinae]